MNQQISKLALILGKGEVTEKLIESCQNKNINFIVIGIKGHSKKSFIKKHGNIWINLTQLAHAINILQHYNISHICFAGAVNRPSIVNFKFDSLTKSWLKDYFQYYKFSISGDNSLLTFILHKLEQDYNIIPIGLHVLAPNLLATKDYYSNKKPNQEEWHNIALGFKVAKQIGELDIGQSIVIQEQLILAVEGVEGTAKLIKRSGKLQKRALTKGILIKIKKPNQDDRIDLPTIGLQTLKQIKKAKLAGIAIEKNSTLLLNEKQVINYANRHNLFVVSFNENMLTNII